MKYARIERERRFLVRAMPADLDLDRGYRQIRDRYLDGTHLRLRHVEASDGATRQLKFTQKLPTDSPLETQITNIYVDAHEFELLERLPARILEKRRYTHSCQGKAFVIDRFLGPLEGLILSEVEQSSLGELEAIAVPAFAHCDVTGNPAFTGGNLARSEARDTLALVHRLLRDGGPADTSRRDR